MRMPCFNHWNRFLLGIGIAVAVRSEGVAEFEPPTIEECVAAVGDLSQIPDEEKAAYARIDDFQRMGKASGIDWLAQHKERGQTYAQFLSDRMPRPLEGRDKIYIELIGDFSSSNVDLDTLVEYCSLFFSSKVELKDSSGSEGYAFSWRINQYTNARQYLTKDILESVP